MQLCLSLLYSCFNSFLSANEFESSYCSLQVIVSGGICYNASDFRVVEHLLRWWCSGVCVGIVVCFEGRKKLVAHRSKDWKINAKRGVKGTGKGGIQQSILLPICFDWFLKFTNRQGSLVTYIKHATTPPAQKHCCVVGCDLSWHSDRTSIPVSKERNWITMQKI
jgi:hypothetical protein